MYAIIAAGGRQYRVSQGDVIYIDKVNQEADSKIDFDVLMIGGDGDVKVGNPVLAGAKVEGKVLAQVKGEKITVYKYKSKKDSSRKIGHRQRLCRLPDYRAQRTGRSGQRHRLRRGFDPRMHLRECTGKRVRRGSPD